MTERAQLLELLPDFFSAEAEPVPALTVTYAGGGMAVLEVSDEQLSVLVDNAEVARLDLTAETLGSLPASLTALAPDVTLTPLLPGVMPAVVLLDSGRVEPPVTLTAWRSATWRVLEALGHRLGRSATKLDAGVAQANLLTSAGHFADLWGQLLGRGRRLDEDDATYTARLLRETLRPRENNQALAALLEEDFPGLEVFQVRDNRPRVFRCSGTPLRHFHLAGRRYNAGVVDVELRGNASREVSDAAQFHVAGGVLAWVVGVIGLDGGPGLGLADTPLQIGPPAPMQIGTGTIGLGAIGS